MVSYMNSMKKMIWGDQPQQPQQAGRPNEEVKAYDTSRPQPGAIRVTPDMIVKQGWIYKRSRYLQQWKK